MNYKVLVVDDIEKNLQLIGNLLRDRGISIMLANSGRKAMAAVSKKMPDLILLDISMPEMDGYQVCEQLKGNSYTKHIPIIFLTAKNETEDLVKGFAYGAVDYITKPFSKDELMSRVLTHLELKKSRDIIAEQNQLLNSQNQRILDHSKMVEQLNRQLNQQNIQLKELVATKDKFFSIIAHDIKSPMSSIIQFTELLNESLEKFTPEKIRAISESLNELTVNSLKLTENLFEWSRSQTGSIKIALKKTEIKDLIDNNIKLVGPQAKDKQIEIKSDCNEEFYVLVDESMMNTVLRNLLTNAVKFTSENGLIEIITKATNYKNKDYFSIAIKDNGVGMSEEELERVFYLDKKVSRKGTKGEKGTGLGLILSKEFIDKLNGRISVESEQDKGSTFTCLIPIYK